MPEMIIDGLEFIEYEPVPNGHRISLRGMCVTITADNTLLVGKLVREALPSTIRILATGDGSRLAIMPSASESNGFRVSKTGRLKAATLIQALEQAGVPLPAKYGMTKRDDGTWVGKLIPAQPITPKPDSAAKKPRKSGLAAMMPKGGTP